MPTPQRCEVFYSGRVQGVGFRYTAQRLAQRHPVTGFVRNLPDGRVHLVVEGADEAVDALLAEIRLEMQGKIRDVQMSRSPGTGEFDSFEIAH
jgi:acylphosphatase